LVADEDADPPEDSAMAWLPAVVPTPAACVDAVAEPAALIVALVWPGPVTVAEADGPGASMASKELTD